MDKLYTRFDGVFFEKTRLSLMTIILQEGTVSFNTLKTRLDMTDGALYTHLEKLVAAGYIRKEKKIADNAAQTVYSAAEEGITVFRDYLNFIEGLIRNRHESREKHREEGEN